MSMSYTQEQLARIWLQCAPMGAWNKVNALKERLGGAAAMWEQFSPALHAQLGEETFVFLADRRADRCASILRQLDSLQARALFRGQDPYPARLAAIDRAPDVLFVRGTLPGPEVPALAMVGSRANTRYGGAQARRIAGGLAQKGVAIISGLAKGIDAASHLGALEGGGPTVAVLGCGIGRMYPTENKPLAARILAEGGAILSELSPDAPPLPHHFPARNRIISGLAQGLLLIEARLKSGTHTTVEYALSQGREVFALPGNVDAPGSELPLTLLKEGATLCTGPEDILSAMGWEDRPPLQPSFFDGGPETADDPILRALAVEEKTLEELLQETGLPVDQLSTQLTLLEISGQIERRAGRAYALVSQ